MHHQKEGTSIVKERTLHILIYRCSCKIGKIFYKVHNITACLMSGEDNYQVTCAPTEPVVQVLIMDE